MIDSSIYLTRKVKVFIWAFVLATFCFSFFILFEREFSGSAHEKFSVEPSQAIELTLDQVLKNVEVSIGSGNGFKDAESLSYARLSQSEIHEVDEWVNGIEYTPENRRIYQSYSDEVIFQLASEGDRNALEEGAQRMILRGDSQTALQMLHEASELGSTSALISTGYWVQSQLESSSVDEALYNRMFGD